MGGLGQGLMLAGTNNRGKSCFIFKKLENEGYSCYDTDSMTL